jgi:hypothetical protein
MEYKVEKQFKDEDSFFQFMNVYEQYISDADNPIYQFKEGRNISIDKINLSVKITIPDDMPDSLKEIIMKAIQE